MKRKENKSSPPSSILIQPGKYYGGAVVKMGGSNPCERCVCTGQDCLVHPSR